MSQLFPAAILIAVTASTFFVNGSALAAKGKLNVHCVTMRVAKLRSVACYRPHELRWDLYGPKDRHLSSWLFEPSKKRFVLIEPYSKKYLPNAYQHMIKLAAGQLAKLKKMHAMETKMLSSAVIKTGRSKWNKESLGGCRMHSIKAPPLGKGVPPLELDLCTKPAPAKMVKVYLDIVTFYRQLLARYQPLRLQGFPMLDVRLKIYRKDGVLKARHLPAIGVLQLPARGKKKAVQKLSFEFEKKTVGGDFFAIPKGYTAKSSLRK
jgi:hypothetical protein